MAGGLVLVKRSPEEVADAPDGKVRIFIDESGQIGLKDDDGNVVAPQALIASLEDLVATKQDASTAATDAELASAVSTLNNAIGLKQDSATAATDAELAAAVSTINTAIAGEVAALEADIAAKQDAASAATDSELTSGLATRQAVSEKGQANGYPSLDVAGHVPAAQMPVGALTYKGTWNAATNTPTLSDGTGTVGDQYAIATGGTRDLGSGSIEFVAGSVLQHNGSIWQQIASPDAVASVFGRKGAVDPQSGDYSVEQILGLEEALDGKQPLAVALTVIAALSTTAFGRGFLELANAGAGRTALGLGSSATKDSGTAAEAGKVLLADDARLLAAIGSIDTVKTVAASGASHTVKLADGLVLDLTLDQTTVALVHPNAGEVGAGKSRSYILVRRQDAFGGRVLDWPANTRFSGDVEHEQSIAAGAIDIDLAQTFDGATTWLVSPIAVGIGDGGSTPQIPAAIQKELDNKEPAANKGTGPLGTSVAKFPNEKTVADAIDAAVAGLTIPYIAALPADLAAITSDASLNNLTGLEVPIGASATGQWLLEYWLDITAANITMDVEFGYTLPAGATARWGALPGNVVNLNGYGAVAAGSSPLGLRNGAQTLSVGLNLGGINGVLLALKVFGGGTAGDVELQYCQDTSDPGALQILKGSLVKATRVLA